MRSIRRGLAVASLVVAMVTVAVTKTLSVPACA